MSLSEEFNKVNYPNVFIDNRIREKLGSHYGVDTSVVIDAIRYDSKLPLYKWCTKHRITFYQPILEELHRKLKPSRSEINKLRKLLDAPNFRFVLPQDYSEVRNIIEELSNRGIGVEDGMSSGDFKLIALSLCEGGEIVTKDRKLDEVSYNCGIQSHNILKESLPREFIGNWDELKRETIKSRI